MKRVWYKPEDKLPEDGVTVIAELCCGFEPDELFELYYDSKKDAWFDPEDGQEVVNKVLKWSHTSY